MRYGKVWISIIKDCDCSNENEIENFIRQYAEMYQ